MEQDDHEMSSVWFQSSQQMAGRIEALMARQKECQQSLEVLAEEQKAFLRDMRAFADGQVGATLSSASGVPTGPHSAGMGATLSSGSALTGSGTFQASLQVGDFQAPDKAYDASDMGRAPRASLAGAPSMPSRISMRGSRIARNRTIFSCGDDEMEDDTCSAERITMSTYHLKTQLSGLFHEHHKSSIVIETLGFIARMRGRAEDALRSSFFEPLMGFVILANAANIGWTIEMELQHKDTSVQTIIEIVILMIFWAELMLVAFALGKRAIRVKWNIFDFSLNLVTTVVLVLSWVSDKADQAGTFTDTVKQTLILRLLRLARLFRAVRIIQMSRSLWKLVEGMKHCLGTMMAALILITISLFTFSCIAAEMITKAYAGDEVVGGLVEMHFSSVPRIMLTLFQFIAMDSTAAIYVQLVHRNPFLFVYFLFLVCVVTIMLMNLITAVVVEDAITTATMDNDMKRHFLREKLRRLRPDFQKLFSILDSSNEGNVVIQDIVSAINSGLHIPDGLKDLVTPSRMLDLFDLLDQDHSGELNESEFVDGLSCLALSEVPLETMQILHLLRSVQREVMRLSRVRGMDTKYINNSGGMGSALPSAIRHSSAAFASSTPTDRVGGHHARPSAAHHITWCPSERITASVDRMGRLMEEYGGFAGREDEHEVDSLPGSTASSGTYTL